MCNLDLSLVIATLSAIFAAVGLILNFWAVRESNKTRQLQLFENTFNRIKDTEKLLYDRYKNSDEDAKKDWDSLFFNELEFFALLVNEKHIDPKLGKFFDEAIVDWYEGIFVKFHKEDLKNKRAYPQLKKLYLKIKNSKNNS